MSDAPGSQNELPVYAIRSRERARRDRNEAIIYLARTTTEDNARDWNAGLTAALATLAILPRRCAVAPERFRGEVRRLLYQRPASKIAHWVYFTIEGENLNSLDAPTVTIARIRHAAAKPLTRTEIREIEAAE